MPYSPVSSFVTPKIAGPPYEGLATVTEAPCLTVSSCHCYGRNSYKLLFFALDHLGLTRIRYQQ